MKQPQEIEVWYVLPAIRRGLVRAMIALGMPQKRIARKLGVTEAAVSQYKSSKRAGRLVFEDDIQKMIDDSAARISSDESTGRVEIQRISEAIKSGGHLCEVHRKYDDSCDATCDICLK